MRVFWQFSLLYNNHNMVFSLLLWPTIKLTRQKMQANRRRFRWTCIMWWRNAGHIARWSTSRASFEATGCRHRASACAVLPRWRSCEFVETTQNTNTTQLLPSNYGTFQALVNSDNFTPQNGPSTQLIDAASFVKMRGSTIGAEELVVISSYQTL